MLIFSDSISEEICGERELGGVVRRAHPQVTEGGPGV